MSGFVFNGKSRTSGLKLARDHCLSRTDVLATAQKTRRAMDEENRRTTAATTIQCAVRRHRAQQDVLARAYHALYALHNLASPTSDDAGSGASSTALVQRWQHAAWCYSAVMRRRHLLSQAFCSALLGPTSGVEKGQTEVLQRCRRPITELMASLSTSSDGHDMCGLLDGVSHNTIVALIETLLHDFFEWTLHPTLVHRTTSPLEVLAMTIHAITHQPRPALVESLACLVMDGCRRELHNSPQARRQLVPILSGLMDSIAVLPSPQMCATLNVGCTTPLLVDACWESLAAPPTSLLGLCSSPVSVLLSVSTTQEDCVDDASLEERARQAAILVHSCYTKLESCTSSTSIHVPSYRHALHALCRLLPFFRELLESQLCGQEEESSNSTIILANPLHRGWMQCIDGLLSVLYSSPHFLKQLMQDIQSLRTATNTDCPHGITCFLQDQGIRFFAMALRAEEEEARRGSPSSTSSSSSPPTTTLSSPMEALMGVYAWPIYGLTLMSSSSADFRSSCEWACCRIASAPNMLAALWRCFRQRSPNLRRLLSSEGEWAELLEQCTRPSRAVHPPRWENAAPQTMFGESLGLRSCIRVDAPALSVLFLRMVAYFLEARNSVGGFDLQLIMNDVELRVFALVMKELVYRACTFGVAPKSKTAAVIHVACDVLAQLYALRQSPSFAGYPSLWIAVEEGKEALLPLVGLSLGAWEDEVDRILRESSRVVEVSDNNNAVEECISRDALLSWAEFSPRFEGSSGWNARERLLRLLVHAPFTVAFAVRGKLLMSLPPPDYDDGSSFMQRETRVSRGTTFADAYAHFQRHPLRSSMAKIRFVDVWGHVEEGYGYGVYREFVLAVCADGLSAEHGLFAQTADGLLFPNPYSLETTGDEDHLGKIEFLGAIVGRAVYDGILQEARFARHFLQTLVGRRSHVRELHHLDPELYHNLQSLKEMSEEELEGLDIRFTVTVMNPLGVGQEVELLPNGAEQRVSRATYEQYIQLVGEYKLNREGHTQTMAFARGLGKVISPTLLRLLNCDELQQLFSGDGRINVDDWERHTTIDQCPDEDRIYIDQFWAVVRSLTTEQQSLLLQFATSLKRPPLLGFRYLSPPFKLQLLDPREDRDRLPTSSTCFSLLKLPRYSSIAIAREKIIAAIEGAHSFEHS